MSPAPVSPADAPLLTPLHALHQHLGAKLVPFAGYALPVHYPPGILAEHLHTRAAASLFDVSHMGQIRLDGPDAAAALETLVPGDITGLGAGRTRYTVFTDENGGILDDLMVTNALDHLFLVVNAARKADDLAHLRERIGDRVKVSDLGGRALLAVQGPKAAEIMERLVPETATMAFMSWARAQIGGADCWLARSGYTGEDGFEISAPAEAAAALAELLLDQPHLKPAGLGARDSLRLEAGLCLHGHDIGPSTSPVEAGLSWTVSRMRRERGGFPGAARIQAELKSGPPRRRVGLLPEGRAPAREHTTILGASGEVIGEITSGGYGPSVGGPIAMGYVKAPHGAVGERVSLAVRNQAHPARIVALPFVAHRYFKG